MVLCLGLPLPAIKVTINPLEWAEVPFTIAVPKEAAYGYYFAITLPKTTPHFWRGPELPLPEPQLFPSFWMLRKRGQKPKPKITQFSVSQAVTEYLPADFVVKVENQGNVHVKPHGDIFITDGKNQLADLPVNPYLGSVIPNAQKVFNASWDDGFLVRTPVMEYGQPKLDKNGKPMETLTINWNKLTSF